MIGTHVRRLRSSRLGRQLVDTAFWSLVGDAAMRGLTMLGLILVARSLGPAAYGEFGLVRSTMLMVASLGGLGLGLMANRYVSEHRENDKDFSGQIINASYLVALTSGAFLGGVVFVCAEPLAASLMGAPQLAYGLKIASVVLLASALNGAQVGIMQGLHAYRNLAIGNFVQGILSLVCMVVGARLGGLDGAMLGIAVQTLAGVALFHAMIAREKRLQAMPTVRTDFRRIWPILRNFCLPVTMSMFAVAPFKWLSETFLARDAGFAELGTFHAALVIVNVLNAVAWTLNAPLISVTAGMADGPQSDRAKLVSLYGSWYAFIVLALPMALFPDVVALLFSEEFRTAGFRAAILLMIVYCGLMAYYQGVMRLFMMTGSLWVAFFTNVVEGIVLFVAFLLLAKHGVVGLGVAYVLSYVARILITIPFLMRTQLMPARLVFDRWFLSSAAVMLAIVIFNYRSPT
jgi:O-antigen/teichoic acid export membrane protein